MIRKTSKQIGKVSGALVGEPLKYLGKKLNNGFVTELGETVKSASIQSFDSAGQAAEGIWNTSAGLVQKDEVKVKQGLNEVKGFAVKTGKGAVETVKQTLRNGEDVYTGIRTGERDRLMNGAKGLAKTAAVATLTIGALDFLDIVDGADEAFASEVDDANPDQDLKDAKSVSTDESEMLSHSSDGTEHGEDSGFAGEEAEDSIHTRNEELAGGMHPETDVPFVQKDVLLPSGDMVIGVFPDFDEVYALSIPDWMYDYSDSQQFHYANLQLSYEIGTDADLVDTFTSDQIQQIANGETPEGYTWHHSEVPGRLELVDTETHAQTAHTGGRELWGGGETKR